MAHSGQRRGTFGRLWPRRVGVMIARGAEHCDRAAIACAIRKDFGNTRSTVKHSDYSGCVMSVLLLSAAAVSPVTVMAQAGPAEPAGQAGQASDQWRFSADLYGYFPDISGKVNFPGDQGSTQVDIPFHEVLSHLKMGFMGAFGAQYGRWGLFADGLYMDLDADKSLTRDFTVGGSTVPVTANVTVGLSAWVWTLAGEYRVVSDPEWTMDLYAGARSLFLKPTLDYKIIDPPGDIKGRKGTSGTSWDGLVGIKGRYAFGDDLKWFVPYYLDIGTGDTQLTWQGLAGVGYSYQWGDLVAAWRYLTWDGKSGRTLQELTLNGPMLGIALHW